MEISEFSLYEEIADLCWHNSIGVGLMDLGVLYKYYCPLQIKNRY